MLDARLILSGLAGYGSKILFWILPALTIQIFTFLFYAKGNKYRSHHAVRRTLDFGADDANRVIIIFLFVAGKGLTPKMASDFSLCIETCIFEQRV
jgi:hypothetical protein